MNEQERTDAFFAEQDERMREPDEIFAQYLSRMGYHNFARIMANANSKVNVQAQISVLGGKKVPLAQPIHMDEVSYSQSVTTVERKAETNEKVLEETETTHARTDKKAMLKSPKVGYHEEQLSNRIDSASSSGCHHDQEGLGDFRLKPNGQLHPGKSSSFLGEHQLSLTGTRGLNLLNGNDRSISIPSFTEGEFVASTPYPLAGEPAANSPNLISLETPKNAVNYSSLGAGKIQASEAKHTRDVVFSGKSQPVNVCRVRDAGASLLKDTPHSKIQSFVDGEFVTSTPFEPAGDRPACTPLSMPFLTSLEIPVRDRGLLGDTTKIQPPAKQKEPNRPSHLHKPSSSRDEPVNVDINQGQGQKLISASKTGLAVVASCHARKDGDNIVDESASGRGSSVPISGWGSSPPVLSRSRRNSPDISERASSPHISDLRPSSPPTSGHSSPYISERDDSSRYLSERGSSPPVTYGSGRGSSLEPSERDFTRGSSYCSSDRGSSAFLSGRKTPASETDRGSSPATAPILGSTSLFNKTGKMQRRPASVQPSPSASKKTNKAGAMKSKTNDNPKDKANAKKAPAKPKKQKLPLMTYAEYIVLIQAQLESGERMVSANNYLEGMKFFYIGGDLTYAGVRTRGRMDYIVRHGGTLVPVYTPTETTHIVVDAPRRSALRALKIKSLSEIPDHIPTVLWPWVTSGMSRGQARLNARLRAEKAKGQNETVVDEEEEKKRRKREDFEVMDDPCMHSAFLERFEAGARPLPVKSRKGAGEKGKGKEKEKEKRSGDEDNDSASEISDFTPEKGGDLKRPAAHSADSPPAQKRQKSGQAKVPSVAMNPIPMDSVLVEKKSISDEDPLAEFYAQARAEKDVGGWRTDEDAPPVESEHSEDESESDEEVFEPVPIPKRGFTCDRKEVQRTDSPNQDVVDKLQELMQLHKAKPGDEDHWRAYSYGKCLRALRNYPKRIKSFNEARSIRGVGEKTAMKIMEIIETGNLRRIGYERTEDVKTTHVFQGIYGVGQSTAFRWYANGCRTLEDLKAGKRGVKLSAAQEIGIKYYDDINDRMPRAEAQAIFDHIKTIALKLDPELYIDIMGSFRRGKADCGDIDVMITRHTNDGKTHAGIAQKLHQELKVAGIITEDLSIPEDWFDLEICYRGLCRLPNIEGSKRRRIDILAVPYKNRGAALLYYTGDGIFNRAMRLKASVLGYSLNQKGLSAGVVRDPRDRRIKLNEGAIIASETEEEIFKILGVPWQEPHERVRG